MQRNRDYDPFAWLYTRYWGEAFHEAVLPALDRAVLGNLRPGAAVLDLCCGDGRLTSQLERRGFRMTGLDSSEQMLAYASQRCSRTEFLLADARQFTLPPRFEAVISTFDSLNHVLTGSGLQKVIVNVSQCLRPHGTFVFDLNGEGVYRDLWSRTLSTVDDRVVSVARGAFDPRSGLARCDVTVVRLEEHGWGRSDFCLRQKLHRRTSVLRKLEAAGFEAEVHDADRLGMKGHFAAGRDVYVARKIASERRRSSRTRT